MQTRPYRYGKAIFGFDRYGQTEERTYHYDELDQIVEMGFEGGRSITWEYDAEGNVTKMTDPEGKVTRYSYYRDNLLHQVIIERPEEDDRIFTYSYDAAGRLEEIGYPEETEIKAVFRDGTDTPGSGFDASGNMLSLRYEKDSTLLRRFEWTYDDSNNRESMLEVTPTKAVKWDYGYDWLDRLVTVSRAEATDVGSLGATALQREYVFDESDNRVFLDDYVNGVTYHYVYAHYDSGSGLVPSDVLEEVLVSSTAGDRTLPGDFVSLETFEHDEEGNLVRRTHSSTSEELTYDWTEFNSLEKVESSVHGRIQVNRFESEGLRERTLDENGSSAVEYGVGIATSSSRPGHPDSDFPTISYIQGAGGILGFEKNGSFSYFLTDALSTVRDLVDDDGVVLASYEFDEYGQRLATNENGASSPKTFVGGLSVQDEVAETGLMLMGHRFYDPTLGRFLNRDPIGFAGGLNLFGYGGNNPLRFVDAAGLNPVGDAVNWWLWDSTVPGPYGNPNPEDWGTLGDVGSWNDLVDYVCSHGSGAERVLFVSALITGVGATAIAGGTGLAQASGRIPQMVLDGKKFGKSGGRIFQIRPNVGRGSSKRASEGIFRLDYHKLPKGNAKTLHYHRKPNMKQHHSLGGKEFAALAGAAAGYIALIIQCKPKKECE